MKTITLSLFVSLLLSMTAFANDIEQIAIMEQETISTCKDFTSNIANEMTCIQQQNEVDFIKACRNYTTTSLIEGVCLKSKNISTEGVKMCKSYTTNSMIELHCLNLLESKKITDLNVIKGCRQNTHNSALEVICLNNNVAPGISKICYSNQSTHYG